MTFLGHKDRLDPAVFSPEAEKVQELEALCGQFHSGLLISDRFWGTLKNSEKFNKRLMTALRGENVYEILDILPAAQLLQRKKNNESFALGVAAFWGAEYSMALMAFEGCLRSDVSDRAAKQYADRARGYVDATLMPNIDRQVDAGGFI